MKLQNNYALGICNTFLFLFAVFFAVMSRDTGLAFTVIAMAVYLK